MPAKQCRRGHALTPANVRVQVNTYYPRKLGKRPTKTEVRVCVACVRWRNARKAEGKPIKDLRKGTR